MTEKSIYMLHDSSLVHTGSKHMIKTDLLKLMRLHFCLWYVEHEPWD